MRTRGVRVASCFTLVSSVGLLLTACSSTKKTSTTNNTTTGGSGTSPSSTATNYDPEAKITLAIAAPNTGLDPAQSKQLGDIPYLSMVYDSLTFLDAKGTVKPALATEWKTADDGKSMTLKLRSGVAFHDGTPFNAPSSRRRPALP
jgi:peptide/nickel transport system substrate-binding protein